MPRVEAVPKDPGGADGPALSHEEPRPESENKGSYWFDFDQIDDEATKEEGGDPKAEKPVASSAQEGGGAMFDFDDLDQDGGAMRAVELCEVPDQFVWYDGYITEGPDLHCALVDSLEEAKATALKVPRCKGFTFEGDFTKGSVVVWYKEYWAVNGPGSGWFAYKLLEDEGSEVASGEEPRRSLADEHPDWSAIEGLLWNDTGGLFVPEPRAREAASSSGARDKYCSRRPMVSVVCPTMASRRCFHPFLWMCFKIQTYEERQLVVVETCEDDPSEFWATRVREDSRVIYRHFQVPEAAWSIGLKRNLACYFATGSVIAHFDDDDMYGRNYLQEMVTCLRNPSEAWRIAGVDLWCDGLNEKMLFGMTIDPRHVKDTHALGYALEHIRETKGLGVFGAACVKLACWNEYTLKTRTWSLFNAVAHSANSLWGWGFSLVYLRSAWEAAPFRHIDLGEDFQFVQRLRYEMGLPVLLLSDSRGICAHTCHAANTTGNKEEKLCRGGSCAAQYAQVASLVGLYENAAQGILERQAKMKETKSEANRSPE